MIASNDFESELHHTPLGTTDVIVCHLQSFLVMIGPILFRQPSKNKEDGFFHPILDCVNVFPFQMVNSEAPPFSMFCVGEKIEDMLFEVNFFAVNIQWCLKWTEVIEVAEHLRKSQLAIVGKTCIDRIINDLIRLACWATCAWICVALLALRLRCIMRSIKAQHIAQ